MSFSHKSPDFILMSSLLLLLSFGIVMVYNTSVAIAIRDFGDPYHFIGDQIIWGGVGLIALFSLSRIDYHLYYQVAVPVLLGTLVALVLVFFPVIGVRVMGASRWLNFGFFTLQPSELAKLAVTLYLAAWLSTKEKERFGAFLLFLGLTVGLVVIQPDVGTSVILLLLSLSVYLVAGAPVAQLLKIVPIVLVIFALVAVAAPYRLRRITTFLNPDEDPLGSSYQIRQSLIAVGNGGLFGVGLGKSKQKYEYLPEANTDAIFAVIAEEVGFVGSSFLLGLIVLIIWRGFRIAARAPDIFGKLIATGISAWFSFQSAINIGATISLFPLTGVPLPMVSYGGSSLVILCIAFGILLNISKQKNI